MQVAEEMVPWDYESLHADIASELNEDKQPIYASTSATEQGIAL